MAASPNHDLPVRFEGALRWKMGHLLDDQQVRAQQWKTFLLHDPSGKTRATVASRMAALAARATDITLNASSESSNNGNEYVALKDFGGRLVHVIRSYALLRSDAPPGKADAARELLEKATLDKLEVSLASQKDTRILGEAWQAFLKWLGDAPSSDGMPDYTLRFHYFREWVIKGAFDTVPPTLPANSVPSPPLPLSPRAPNGPPVALQRTPPPLPPSSASSPTPIGHAPLDAEPSAGPVRCAPPIQPLQDLPSPITPPASTASPPTPVQSPAWKYLPVPATDPDPHEPIAGSCHRSHGMELLAARVRGKKHKHEGTNCDDWFEVTRTGEWTIIAVSDGAGSKTFSRIGARAACTTAVAVLRSALADLRVGALFKDDLQQDADHTYRGVIPRAVQDALIGAMSSAASALSRLVSEQRANDAYIRCLGGRGLVLDDLACALLLAVHVPATLNGERVDFVMSAQVGDGMIGVVTDTSTVVIMGDADSGEYSGETHFLTSDSAATPHAIQSKVVALACGVRALMVMTDGVGDDYFPGDPGLLTLYIDLILNGILPVPLTMSPASPHSASTPLSHLSLESIADSLPRLVGPQAQETVRIKSANKLLTLLDIEPAHLLDTSDSLRHARALGDSLPHAQHAGDALAIWLDTYHVRGSFDDRTIAILHPLSTGTRGVK